MESYVSPKNLRYFGALRPRLEGTYVKKETPDMDVSFGGVRGI